MANYRALDPAKIIGTLDQLERRIEARFPASGLARLSHDVAETARAASANTDAIAAPSLRYRLFGAAAIGIGALVLGYIALNLDYRRTADSVFTVLQGVDSAFNIIVLMGASSLAVMRLEQISKRNQALKHLHELRSLIHIIDMHQLTKDPSAMTLPGPATAASPKRLLTPFELSRYLDYCSEMLSLTAKIAALYAQSSKDSVVISTVNELENLAANLSEKIWQKIGMLQRDTAPPALVQIVPSAPLGPVAAKPAS
jgi:hypothetical protein